MFVHGTRLRTHTDKTRSMLGPGPRPGGGGVWKRGGERLKAELQGQRPDLAWPGLARLVTWATELLRGAAAAGLRGPALAGPGPVVLQTLQDALGQQFDVCVRLRVHVDELQLLQAALLQQHAAVAGG